jgi:hypothetical protein
MNKSISKFLVLSLLLFPLLTACNLPVESEVPEEVPTATLAPPTNVPTETPVPTVTPIQHQSIPGELPAERSGQAGDHDSSVTSDQKRAPGGDRFTFGRYERPFNAETMDMYFPYLDIQDTLVYQDDVWIYAVITLESGDEKQQLSGRYGFEIDTDLDGGGDWLVLADSPSSTKWSTEGVQVWFDTNDDVGGGVAVNADDNAPGGNGYETMLFDSDQGDDPDLAWARVSPDDPNTLQLAVKRSILGGDDTFMTGMWAGNDILDPAMFDMNDHFTHEQAGAALVELEYFYPIKAISELDNSCRMAVGFQSTGNEPGICSTASLDSGESCQPVACTGNFTYYCAATCTCARSAQYCP